MANEVIPIKHHLGSGLSPSVKKACLENTFRAATVRERVVNHG
jgi:hypothetical protein